MIVSTASRPFPASPMTSTSPAFLSWLRSPRRATGSSSTIKTRICSARLMLITGAEGNDDRNMYSAAVSGFESEILIGSVKFFETRTGVAQADAVRRNRFVFHTFAVVLYRQMQLSVAFV